MLQHCRPTVERYIFGKLDEKLFAMYKIKNEKDDKEFFRVSQKIQTIDPITTIKFLGVREKFIFDTKKPYSRSIAEIDKLAQQDNPQDMVTCLSLMNACLKTEVVDYHKGKVELEAMDDVLPLFIYCVAMSNLEHAASLHNMMDDYLRQMNGFDLERKLLCNFDCAVRYVRQEWENE